MCVVGAYVCAHVCARVCVCVDVWMCAQGQQMPCARVCVGVCVRPCEVAPYRMLSILCEDTCQSLYKEMVSWNKMLIIVF